MTRNPWHNDDGILYPPDDCDGQVWIADLRSATNQAANARLIAAAPALAEALRLLYENTADYIRINHLGDVHHNRDMQLARDALKAAGVE